LNVGAEKSGSTASGGKGYEGDGCALNCERRLRRWDSNGVAPSLRRVGMVSAILRAAHGVVWRGYEAAMSAAAGEKPAMRVKQTRAARLGEADEKVSPHYSPWWMGNVLDR
jgi:hypothetical protein